MFKKNRSEIQTIWSEKMLREFIDNFLSPLSGSPGRIPFLIAEKETHIHFSENKTKDESLGYYGILPPKGLENVQFFLSEEWPSSKEHKGSIGYLELLNGVTKDLHSPGPIIRGFIKTDLGFFETFRTLILLGYA
jgi:hypothetical protein